MLNQKYSEYLSLYDGELETMELLYNFKQLQESDQLDEDEKEDLYDLLGSNILLHIIHHFNNKGENQLIKNVIVTGLSEEHENKFIETLQEFRNNFMEILDAEELLDLDKGITIHLSHKPVFNYPTAHYSFSIQNLIANIQQTSMQQIGNTTK